MRPADALLEALQGCERILLTGPSGPDGDSIGACLALQRVLLRRGLRVDVAGEPAYRYAWMPGASAMIADAEVTVPYDGVVVLDGDRHRLEPRCEAAFAAARVKGIVDHHASTVPDGYTHFWVQPTAGSTCEMIYDALCGWSEPLDEDLAALLYVGTIFDTGGFRYSNTTPETHHMAAALQATGIDHTSICTRVLMERKLSGLRVAGHVFSNATLHLDGQLLTAAVTRELHRELGLVPGDVEGVVDSLVFVTGVEVAALFIERAGGEVKVSLRSRGRINVAEVAATLTPSGGGHAKASGACLQTTVQAAEAATIEAVSARLPSGRPSAGPSVQEAGQPRP